jgi:hypothetical protein
MIFILRVSKTQELKESFDVPNFCPVFFPLSILPVSTGSDNVSEALKEKLSCVTLDIPDVLEIFVLQKNELAVGKFVV